MQVLSGAKLNILNLFKKKSLPLSAKILFDHFSNLYLSKPTNIEENILCNIMNITDCAELNVPFTQLEVQNYISKLSRNKSPGPDGICTEMLINTKQTISPFLTEIFTEYSKVATFQANGVIV